MDKEFIELFAVQLTIMHEGRKAGKRDLRKGQMKKERAWEH